MKWRLLSVIVSAAAVLVPAAALDSPTPAELLLDQSRAAPGEIFADVAFRLIRANVLPPSRQVEVMEEVFRRAGEARQPLPMRARSGQALVGRIEFEARAYGLHLDAISLRARAVQVLASRDLRLARQLFEEIPSREWPTGVCEQDFVLDPLLYFQALKQVVAKGGFSPQELEKREPLQLAERTLRSITSIEEFIAVGPMLRDLAKSTGDADRLRIAFTGAATAVKAAMEQQPKCAAETTPKRWNNEEEFRALLREIEGLKMQDRDPPDWAYRALQIMRKVEDWRDVAGVSLIDAFHQRVKLWQTLRGPMSTWRPSSQGAGGVSLHAQRTGCHPRRSGRMAAASRLPDAAGEPAGAADAGLAESGDRYLWPTGGNADYGRLASASRMMR